MKGKLVGVDTTVVAGTEAAQGAKSPQLYKQELCRLEGRRSRLQFKVSKFLRRISTIAKLQAGLPRYNIQIGKNGQPRPGYERKLAVPILRSITSPGVQGPRRIYFPNLYAGIRTAFCAICSLDTS